MLRHWQAVQKDAADARLLCELQLMHQASLHHRKMLSLRSLHGWALAAAASREEAAAQARKDATWDKIQQWLAEDTGRQTSSEAIIAQPFLQVVCGVIQAHEVKERIYMQTTFVTECTPETVLLREHVCCLCPRYCVLQDISGPAPASDPLLASLERALMKDLY